MTTPAPAAGPNVNLEAALAYAARGWRVIPIPPGQKRPGITAWQREGTTDEAKIRHWWTNAPDHGIGIVTGPESNLWVVDVDVAGDKNGDESLDELQGNYEPLPDTYEVITGSGGRHLYFTWPEGADIRNDQSGRLGPGIDVRAEGGQVLAPPTIHPNGRAYEVEASAPDEPADPPAWLVAVLTHQAEAPTPRAAPSARTDRPGDQWAATTTWDELLGADGWTLGHVDRSGEQHWVRPGKTAREGSSATVGYKGSDVLKVFTTSMSHAGLEPEGTYTKFGYLTATRFGGDFSAARAALSAAGHGDQPVDLDELGLSSLALESADQAWEDPSPLPAPPAPDPFPVDSLPEWSQPHVMAAADQVQVPVDLTAMLTIGALSAAATGRARVHVSANWIEPVNLYLVTAMRSGAGKSPADKLTVNWLRTWQRERIEAVRIDWENAQLKVKHARKKLTKLEGGMGEDVDLFAAAAEVRAAEADVPQLPRLLADDATPEAVAGLLREYGQRLAILSTEADLFDMLLKGKPGQRNSMNIYLKAWSGDSFTRDRKGGTETGPEYAELSNPLLTVSVTVQPSVLGKVQADEEMVSRGFAARFMFALPVDMIGRRDQTKRFRSERLATTDTFETTARALADRWASWGHPADLRFSPAAADALEAFLVEIEPQLGDDEGLEYLAEWANKLHGSIARYAGLLHLAEGRDTNVDVAVDTVARAITLGRYWLTHAVSVLGLRVERTVEQAEAVLTWAAESSLTEFTLSQCQQNLRRPSLGLDKVGDFVPAVELLVELGWLRPVDNGDWRAQVGVRGSKSPGFRIFPSVVGKPQAARVSRVQRFASMGERDSPPPPSDGYPLRGSREALNSRNSEPLPAVDNSSRSSDAAEPAPVLDPEPPHTSNPDPADDPAWSIFAEPKDPQ